MQSPDPDFFVETIPNPVHGPGNKRRWSPWIAPVFPLILGGAATAIGYHAGGMSLGLFLGGLFWAALLTPQLVSGEGTWLGRSLATLGMIHGIAGVWFCACGHDGFPMGLFARCYVALAAYVIALAGLTAFVARGRLERAGAGIVTLLSLGWFFWPIWASPIVTEPMVEWLVPAHPVFAVNAVVRDRLGYWVEQAIAYHYTSLSDDVSYTLPGSIWPCVLLHLGIGVGCVVLTIMTTRRVKAGLPAA